MLWARVVHAVARLPPDLAAQGEAIQAKTEAAVRDVTWLAGDVADLERERALDAASDSGPISRRLDARITILSERATRTRRAAAAVLLEVEDVADDRLARVRAAAVERLRAAVAEAEELGRRLREGAAPR